MLVKGLMVPVCLGYKVQFLFAPKVNFYCITHKYEVEFTIIIIIKPVLFQFAGLFSVSFNCKNNGFDVFLVRFK